MPPQSHRKPNRRPPAPHAARQPTRPDYEIVDPIWLLKALALTGVAAAVCAWIALCLLYYVGSWQLILHPSHTVDRTPESLGLPFEDVRFDASETGQPRLTGWWIPAVAPVSTPAFVSTPKYVSDTVLYLHDGFGSLSATLPTLALLHSAGINVFAIDYRGFGRSDASSHPSSASMAADASAAFAYLTSTRYISARNIVPYGAGLGASLAATLARSQPGIPAVIIDNPDPDPTASAAAAHPPRMVPIRLILHEHFEIAAPLATLSTPKLLIAGGPNRQTAAQPEALPALFHSAASPSFSLILPAQNPGPALLAGLTRFLDQYLPRT